jgi:hypothetical protein
MAAEATVKSLFENFPSLHAREEFSSGGEPPGTRHAADHRLSRQRMSVT